MKTNKFNPFTIVLGILTSLLILNYFQVPDLKAPAAEMKNIYQSSTDNGVKKKEVDKSSCLLESNFISAYIKMRTSDNPSRDEQVQDEENANAFNFLFRIARH